MIDLGWWVSFMSGVSLMFFAGLVMWAYRPLNGHKQDALSLAVFVGFLAHGGNTLYWQVFGQIAVHSDWLTVSTLRSAGNWLDLFFKGGGALAGYLHLRAIWSGLPDQQRTRWHVLEMAFYPRRVECIRRLMRKADQ